MRDLVREGLVTQVLPGQHLWAINDLEETFIQYIDDKRALHTHASQFALNRLSSHNRRRSLVHMKKLGHLPSWLVGNGLAERVDSSWYAIDDWVAAPFMAYLVPGREVGFFNRNIWLYYDPMVEDRASAKATSVGIAGK